MVCAAMVEITKTNRIKRLEKFDIGFGTFETGAGSTQTAPAAKRLARNRLNGDH